MASYLSATRLRLAVERLRQSRASGGMVNFLILKRALLLAPEDSIALSLKDDAFQQAMRDLAWWPESPDSEHVRPYIDVFGSMNAKNHGMKKLKYRSNGPADTLKNGSWSSVVAVSEGQSSKVARLQPAYREGLAEVTVLKDGQRPMPILEDAAVWYFRGEDVSSIIGDEDDTEAAERLLAQAFCEELQLDNEDVQILFNSEDADAS